MSFTVYKSSAGSGKTFTLVKEYLRMALSDRNDTPQQYRHILAITFTNKAAAEMKERILRALMELSSRPGLQESTLTRMLSEELLLDPFVLAERARLLLTAILHNYSDFAIGTIDSFVHRIVRTFAYDLRLPMNFEVETDADKLLTQAVDLLIGRIGGDAALTELLVQFAETKTDDDRSWHIEQELRDMAQQLLREEGAGYADRLRQLTIGDFSSIRKKLARGATDFEDEIKALAKAAADAVRKVGLDHAAFYQGNKGVLSWLNGLAEGDLEKLANPNSYVRASFEEGKWHAGKSTAADKAQLEGLLPLLEEAWNTLQERKEKDYGTYVERSLLLRNCYALAVLNEIEKLLFTFKTENNILHISEFNRIISRVVFAEPVPFIYERLGEKYTNYLIDEFQDTSVLQWQNLLPLVENALAENQFTMIVGDGKQAIYRWRGGEVEQFARLPKVYGNFDNELVKQREQSLMRHFDERKLFRNFRSKCEVVQFNNLFFRTLAGKLDGLYAGIYEGLEQEFDPNNTGGYVQIERIEAERADRDVQHLTRTTALVQQLLAENFRPSEIAILTRTNGHGSLIAAALIAQGIPVLSSESLLLRLSPAVNFMAAALRTLDHPDDTIARAQMLHFLVTENKIPGPLHDQLFALLSEEGGLPALLAKHEISFPMVILAKQPLYQRCESLLQIFDLNTEPDPYLTGFLDEVLSFGKGRRNNPADFSTWWDERRKAASLVVPEGLDAVHIMTIHKSKGLEFPAVILPFADWRIKNSKDQLWVEWEDELTPELPVALLPVSVQLEDTKYAGQFAEEKNKSLLDDLNLVYVAMTRPAERLYVLTGKAGGKNTFGTVSDFYDYYFTASGITLDENRWATGTPSPPSSPRREKKQQFIRPPQYHHFAWPEKISIRSNAGSAWAADEADKNRDRGILVHSVLSRVKTIDDLENALRFAVSEGLLDDEEREDLHVLLIKLLHQPKLEPWFSPGLDVRNEADILLPDGSMYRPDRVVLTRDQVVLIDYKTGREAETHIRQLNRYARLLIEMGHRKILKLLVYTEDFRVEEIE